MKLTVYSVLVSACLLCVMPSCAAVPPNLTPAAQSAFKNTQAIKILNVVRDFAIDANAQTPPMFSTDSTRKVVQAHESLLKIINADQSGWQNEVTTTLQQLLLNLPDRERTLLRPYVNLVVTEIQGGV